MNLPMPTMTTLSSKGQLVIPKEIRESLGIEAGTRIAMTVEDDKIILRPATTRLLDKLYGIAAGGPSMADELMAERRKEHQRSEEREAALISEGLPR
jgi:AbrB family looped-hinge helix DNA binding protein